MSETREKPNPQKWQFTRKSKEARKILVTVVTLLILLAIASDCAQAQEVGPTVADLGEATPVPTLALPSATPQVSSEQTPTPIPNNSSSELGLYCAASHLNEIDNEDEIEEQLTLMSAAGITVTRFDIPQAQIEPAQGQFDWTRIDNIVQMAKSHHIKIIGLLNINEAPLWQQGDLAVHDPMTPENYASYVNAVAAHFKGKIDHWQIGNEPNLPAESHTGMDAKQYVNYLTAAYPAIKAANPQAQILGGNLYSGLKPIEYLNDMYANGAQGKFDALGYNDYDNFPTLDQVHAVMQANGDGKKLMDVTESGIPSGTGVYTVSEEEQADLLTQLYDEAKAKRQIIGTFCWYDAENDGKDINNREHNFGLWTTDHKPKLDYFAMQRETGKMPPPSPTP